MGHNADCNSVWHYLSIKSVHRAHCRRTPDAPDVPVYA